MNQPHSFCPQFDAVDKKKKKTLTTKNFISLHNSRTMRWIYNSNHGKSHISPGEDNLLRPMNEALIIGNRCLESLETQLTVKLHEQTLCNQIDPIE
jgi:hypothetical protein